MDLVKDWSKFDQMRNNSYFPVKVKDIDGNQPIRSTNKINACKCKQILMDILQEILKNQLSKFML